MILFSPWVKINIFQVSGKVHINIIYDWQIYVPADTHTHTHSTSCPCNSSEKHTVDVEYKSGSFFGSIAGLPRRNKVDQPAHAY